MSPPAGHAVDRDAVERVKPVKPDETIETVESAESAEPVEPVEPVELPLAHVELSGPPSEDCVILLHGLARTASSMESMADALNGAGYRVANVDYPSRHHRIQLLSDLAIPAGVEACGQAGASRLQMVTHSLGGILVRDYLSRHRLKSLQRVVMLAPPNHGSAVVDNLQGVPGFHWLNGPAIQQLGTDAHSLPLQLGPATVDTAVIAGSRSVNLYLSTFLENPDDGKVSVASARLDGMCAMLVLTVSHPFIMSDAETIEQVLSYLADGRFTASHAEYPDCRFRRPNG
ncbi:esterase/lipase family protein [Granulosicoccus sp. 3-233]|uniref:esterase/lipase family protein n=1 Tax=Granulosicoccus sp. 3-233 TaxID=3417969 RepID=UPI003D34793F